MTSGKQSSRKTSRKVRMPATKFAHLQKRLTKAPNKHQRIPKK